MGALEQVELGHEAWLLPILAFGTKIEAQVLGFPVSPSLKQALWCLTSGASHSLGSLQLRLL